MSSVPGARDSYLRMKLVNANQNAAVSGGDKLPGRINYYIGNDPKKWHTNVPTYAQVRYRNVYPGINLAYYGNQGGRLEYDFVVAPGAHPGAIALALEGEGSAPLRAAGGRPFESTADGDLVIQIGAGEVRFGKPEVYQERGQESGIRSQEQAPQDKAERTIAKPIAQIANLLTAATSSTPRTVFTSRSVPMTTPNPSSSILRWLLLAPFRAAPL